MKMEVSCIGMQYFKFTCSGIVSQHFVQDVKRYEVANNTIPYSLFQTLQSDWLCFWNILYIQIKNTYKTAYNPNNFFMRLQPSVCQMKLFFF